jgi:hypothetical protein
MATNTRIGQSSAFTPSVCVHRGRFHMVFVANNDTRELLHAVSENGLNWSRLNNVGQTTKSAPALASFGNQLRVVFVANNDTNTLLETIFDDSADVWTKNTPITTVNGTVTTSESSKAGPVIALNNGLFMYYVANNNSNDLLALHI